MIYYAGGTHYGSMFWSWIDSEGSRTWLEPRTTIYVDSSGNKKLVFPNVPMAVNNWTYSSMFLFNVDCVSLGDASVKLTNGSVTTLGSELICVTDTKYQNYSGYCFAYSKLAASGVVTKYNLIGTSPAAAGKSGADGAPGRIHFNSSSFASKTIYVSATVFLRVNYFGNSTAKSQAQNIIGNCGLPYGFSAAAATLPTSITRNNCVCRSLKSFDLNGYYYHLYQIMYVGDANINYSQSALSFSTQGKTDSSYLHIFSPVLSLRNTLTTTLDIAIPKMWVVVAVR